jgi:hypothetical protein
MTTGRINQVTTNSNDTARVSAISISSSKTARSTPRSEFFAPFVNQETDNRLRIPSAFP